jgi:hypothetical protein
MTSPPSESAPTGVKHARNLEALVWGAAALVILSSLAFASTETAVATAVAALFSAGNFSLGRYSLQKLLNPQGPPGGMGRAAFGLLYASKFGLLAIVLAYLTTRAKLSLDGLLLGFTTLPLAMYALLARELLARLPKSKAATSSSEAAGKPPEKE